MKKIKLIIITMLILTSFATIGHCITTQKTVDKWQEISYTIRYGDTLWNICKDYCPKGIDLREYIYLIEQENNINAGHIYEGQNIVLLEEVE